MSALINPLRPLAEWLWYEKSSVEREWTSTPIGHPYVDRLVTGQAKCYSKVSSGIIREKKKLILADWTAEQWDLKKLTEVKEQLLNLIKEGFEILIWQKNEKEPFVKLSIANIHLLDDKDFRKNITPIVSQELIKKATSGKGMSFDEIEVLNVARIKELLKDNTFNTGSIYDVSVEEIEKSNFNISTLVNLIKTDHDGKIFINKIDKENIEYNTLIKALRDKPYELQVVEKTPLELRFSHEVQKDFNINACRALFLNEIKKDDDLVWLRSNLKEKNNLRILGVCNFDNFTLNFTEHSLDNLEALYLKYFEGNNENLEKIFMLAKHIEFLSCVGLRSKLSINIMQGQIFQKLKSLELSLFYAEDLRFFLSHTTTIETLMLSKLVEDPIKPEDIPPDSLVYLKSFTMSHCRLSEETLKCILMQANFLENLTLYDSKIPTDIKLKNLKCLELNNCNISESECKEFLSPSFELEKLSIINTTIASSPDVEQLFGSLLNLKELNVSYSNVSSSFLKTLLKQSPNLRTLDISGLPLEALDFFDDDLELKNLENLTIDAEQIPILMKKGLQNIIVKAIFIKIKQREPYIKILNTTDPVPLGRISENISAILKLKEIVKEIRKQEQLDSPMLEDLSIVNPVKKHDSFIDTNRKDYVLSELRNSDKWSTDREKYVFKTLPDAIAPSVSSPTASSSDVPSTHVYKKKKSNGKKKIDMNTKYNANTRHNVNKCFWGIQVSDPHVAHYRINAYDKVEVSENISLTNEHEEKSEHNLKLINPLYAPCFCEQDTFNFSETVTPSKGKRSFYGKTSVYLGSEWQPLPSLSSEEAITHIHIPGINKEDIDLKYSERDKLYYVRIHNQAKDLASKEIPIDYLLTTPWPIDRSGLQCSNELKRLVQKYKKNLGDTDLPEEATDDSSDYKNNAEILEALQQQTLIGACRHRVLAFKMEATQLINEGKLPANTRVRIITNACHAYLEIEEEIKGVKERSCVDLGGHPSELNISNKNAPKGVSNDPENVILPSRTAVLESLSDTKETIEHRKIEHSRFNTWTPKISKSVNLKMYAQHILNGVSEHEPGKEVKNCLIPLNSKEDIENFRLYIQTECSYYQDKEVYYIDTPEDLVCASNWIEREGEKGIPRGGPGGPLHVFLTHKMFREEPKKTPVLVVNWNNFKPKDVIKFNALYDTKERRADGTVLPEHTRIIGLFNPNNPRAYKGNDFFRRWDINALSKELQESLSHQKEIQEFKDFFANKPIDFSQETEVIDLYESADWKEMLLGRPTLQGKEIVFEQGLLEAALIKAKAEHKVLEIKNGPWHDETFRTFWQQQKLAGKLEGIDSFVRSTGYDWPTACQPEDPKQTFTWNRVSTAPVGTDVFVLNPTVFSKFFYDYIFQPSGFEAKTAEGMQGDLFKKPGLLEKRRSGKPFPVYVTRNLSAHQWAEFLGAAKKHQVSLDIHLAPNIVLPSELDTFLKKEIKDKAETVFKPGLLTTKIYSTSDTYYTTSKLKEEYPGSKVINISELAQQDLLEGLKPKRTGLLYSFLRKSNILLALNERETVILKGKFKPELVDALSSLCIPGAYIWVNGKRLELSGKILFVSENDPLFKFTNALQENEKEIFEYKSKLIEKIQNQQKDFSEALEQKKQLEWLQTRSVVQLESALRYVRETANDPRTNWEGLVSIQEGSNVKNKEISLSTQDLSLEASENFKKARYKQINDVLSGERNNPFVFIAGSTGVGKSSFIQKELENFEGSPYKVYIGLDHIQEWVKNTKNAEMPVLFIDEANIDAGDFSNYEGLFDKPPHMIINGQYVELTDKHKVIFAGNPLSYGSRKMPALFDNYGGSIVFPPMSPAYVYHKVLEPILNATIDTLGTEEDKKDTAEHKKLSEALQQEIGLKILSIYEYLVALSEDKILISPRELQMMVLLMMAQYKNTGSLTEQNIAKIIKTITSPLIPECDKKDFEEFCEQKLGVIETVDYTTDRIISKTASTDAFLVTASRREIDNEISDFLSVRELKRAAKDKALKEAAGLGGIILEGEPGLGKSEFVINLLVEKKFKEKHFNSEMNKKEPVSRDTTKNFFYKMPVSMEESVKEQLLLRAFHEGSIVIIDELNSSPMMENLLNALLMGYDLQGNRPMNPGFGIIATQNPISMAGREAASSAIEHRFLKRYFLPYSTSEMEAIVEQRGLSAEDAQALVEEYNDAQDYAHKYHKEPAPTFGHLMKAVKWKVEAQAREQQDALSENETRIAAARTAGREAKIQMMKTPITAVQSAEKAPDPRSTNVSPKNKFRGI